MHDFVHLHVHSEYSLLDGYASTKAISERAAELGMDSIALTDHGVMYGAMEFYAAAKKANVKPIIGVEAYMAPNSRRDPMTKGGKNYFHLLLLAKNEVGYRNLVKLTTRSHLDGNVGGIFARPRIDWELLQQHHEGIVVTSSCIAGEVIQQLTQQQKAKAREVAANYRDLLGDNYFLELQLHENTPELEEINDELVRIGKELGIPLVATNDTHFVRREDLEAQKMVMAMGFNLTLQELCSKNYTMDESYHIMTGEEMWQRFKKYGTAPLENTRRIADMCNLKLDFGRVQLPAFEIPEGHDAASYLRQLSEEGLMRRFNGQPSEKYVKQLDYELDVINKTGFPDYILIVWDYVKYARLKGIPCIPRGSTGSSLVIYCLGITDVDPLANKLLFERFLSPERLEMPDIDTDFADSRRHEILDYLGAKYGRENVAQIITYGTLGAKAALRDIGRVLDVPLSEVDKVAKLVPSLPVGTTIASALDRVAELRQIRDSNPDLAKVIGWAQKVEGRMRNVGTHACGVVISRFPLETMVPLQRTTKDEHGVMAAYEGPTLAKIGLLKMDILGLTNLSIVADALNYIEQNTGKRIELSEIPIDDPAVFTGLGRGETANVFQLESAGMTRYIKELKPNRVEDLYAMIALYRPGPLEQIPVYIHNKNNPRAVSYLHPILKPILEDTYGVIVYQEQIMQLLQTVADYTLGEAYIVIKAISKKNKELMAENSVRFMEGCRRKGLTKDQATQLWELILPFAGYSFNLSHAVLYGRLTYQTAYLKHYYPVEYMAAVLTGAGGVTDDVAKAVTETRRLGVAVLPPDVNTSNQGFTIIPLPGAPPAGVRYQLGIRFGLGAIKNVGLGPVEAIIRARGDGGSFRSLEDICARVERSALNKRTVESLIKAGALDTLPGMRRQKLAILDAAITAGVEAQKARESGQESLFGDLFGGGGDSAAAVSISAIPLPIISESPADKKETLGWEKELLGTNVSEDPVMQALDGIDSAGAVSLGQLTEEHIGKKLDFVGVLSGTRKIMTKKGDSMLVGTLEDMDSSIEFVAFPRALEKFKELLVDDGVVRVSAKVDNRRDALQLMIESASAPIYRAAAPAAPAIDAATIIDMTRISVTSGVDVYERSVDSTTMEALAVAVEAPPVAGAELPAPGPYANGHSGNGRANGANGSNGHASGHANGNGHKPAASSENGNGHPPEPPAAPVTVIRPRAKVSLGGGESGGGGNGNGHSNGNGGGNDGGRHLRLYLPRSSDFDADVQRMQELDQLLRSTEGGDQVTIYLPEASGTVLLRPKHTVHAAPDLLGGLRQLLGDGGVILD